MQINLDAHNTHQPLIMPSLSFLSFAGTNASAKEIRGNQQQQL